MKIAFLFPGQGVQKIGMGRDLYEKYEEVRDIYKRASKISGIDVATLCFNGIRKEYMNNDYIEFDEQGEDLLKTENTQIAIATMSLAILELLKKNDIKAEVTVGLSLGEYPALIYSGFINFEDGINLLKTRGFLMQNLSPKEKTSMLAVIGLNSKKIESICEEINIKGNFIVPANYNYSNQTVVSGTKQAIEQASIIFKENGARKVVELKTSGPFHTKLLNDAKVEYQKELKNINFKFGNVKVIKNIDGTFYTKKDDMVDILSNHITNPVRLDKAIDLMKTNNIDTFVEIGPGKALTGFIKKEIDNANILNIYDVDTLNKSLQILKGEEE